MHFTKQGIVLAALAVTLPAISPALQAADVLIIFLREFIGLPLARYEYKPDAGQYRHGS